MSTPKEDVVNTCDVVDACGLSYLRSDNGSATVKQMQERLFGRDVQTPSNPTRQALRKLYEDEIISKKDKILAEYENVERSAEGIKDARDETAEGCKSGVELPNKTGSRKERNPARAHLVGKQMGSVPGGNYQASSKRCFNGQDCDFMDDEENGDDTESNSTSDCEDSDLGPSLQDSDEDYSLCGCTV